MVNDRMSLKIVSLNLGGYTAWGKRIGAIVSYLDQENADVVLLQEVRYDQEEANENQASELNRQLIRSYDFESASVSRFYRPSVGKPYREGLAVLSRMPILRSETLALTQAVDDKHLRLIQNVDMKLDDQKLKLSNIHLSNNKYSVVQLKELMGILVQRDEKRIIAGDFNIFDIHESKEAYEGYLVSVDFKSYISFPSEGKTIDYMLLPDEYSYQNIVATDGLSDHVALSYTINLKN